MTKKSNRYLAEILAAAAILCVLPILLLAKENFTGTWRGRLFDVGQSELGVGCSSGCGPIILRVASVNREKGSAKGKFTSGGSTKEILEAKVMGNKLTFKTEKSPAQINDYEAILNGEYLSVTWMPEGGGARPQTFTLKRSK